MTDRFPRNAACSEPTWAARRAELPDDLCPETLEILRGLRASHRHDSRVEATVQAALVAAGAVDPSAPTGADTARAWGMIALDLAGVGGEGALGVGASALDDADPSSTARVPCFRGLGSGRWQARDGDAYRAAAREALGQLRAARRLRVDPSLDGRLYAVEVDDGEPLAGWELSVPPAWAEAEARRGIIAASGQVTHLWAAPLGEGGLAEYDAVLRRALADAASTTTNNPMSGF